MQSDVNVSENTSGVGENESFRVTRVFAAPREKVYRAWTEPKSLARWWGPKGMTLEVLALDLRPGGAFRYSMQTPDGSLMWGKFVYTEIAPPERLAFLVSFTDDAGNPQRHPLSPTWPLEVLSTLTLTEHDGKTTLTMIGVPHQATAEERQTFANGRDSMHQGFAHTLDRLATFLANA